MRAAAAAINHWNHSYFIYWGKSAFFILYKNYDKIIIERIKEMNRQSLCEYKENYDCKDENIILYRRQHKDILQSLAEQKEVDEVATAIVDKIHKLLE